MKIRPLNKSGKINPANAAFVVIAAVAVIALVLYAMNAYGVGSQSQLGTTSGTGSAASGVAVNPVATYATIDKFSTTAVTGSSYYARDGEAATTTALTNVNPGVQYTYWVSNASYYVAPKVFTAGSLNNNIINKVAVANGSSTITLYDTTSRQTVTSGAYNTSVGANGVANIELSYQGNAKKSSMPFGGVLIVEKNQTFNVNGGVICSGANIAANTGSDAFTVTYQATATDMNSVIYKVLPSIDDGVDVSVKKINCQFQNGATDAAGAYKFTLLPANYYVSNDGKILLDVEQAANGLTTRTGLGSITASGVFA